MPVKLTAEIKASLKREGNFSKAIEILGCLSEARRLNILLMLYFDPYQGLNDIAKNLDRSGMRSVGVTILGQHLQRMRSAGIAECVVEGRHRPYVLTPFGRIMAEMVLEISDSEVIMSGYDRGDGGEEIDPSTPVDVVDIP